MPADNKLVIKQTLLDACMAALQKRLNVSQEAMQLAQDTANEQSNTMGDKFESFREQMQIDRDMYARQYDEGMQIMAVLQRIDTTKIHALPALGAVVVTDRKNFFVSASIGRIDVDGETYFAISPKSPIFQAMAGATKGKDFRLGDERFVVREIF